MVLNLHQVRVMVVYIPAGKLIRLVVPPLVAGDCLLPPNREYTRRHRFGKNDLGRSDLADSCWHFLFGYAVCRLASVGFLKNPVSPLWGAKISVEHRLTDESASGAS